MRSAVLDDEIFERLDPAAHERLDSVEPHVRELAADPSFGKAFRRFLVCSHWPDLLASAGADETTIFYSAYFNFAKFAAIRTIKHGLDAGLEQQLFMMLESAETPLDWNVIAEIDALAKREAAAETTSET